jgi:hypothetical protein
MSCRPVAQAFSLQYRRLSVCRAHDGTGASGFSGACRLKVGDTAGWKACATNQGRAFFFFSQRL